MEENKTKESKPQNCLYCNSDSITICIDRNRMQRRYMAVCHVCGSQGPLKYTEEEAVESWNSPSFVIAKSWIDGEPPKDDSGKEYLLKCRNKENGSFFSQVVFWIGKKWISWNLEGLFEDFNSYGNIEIIAYSEVNLLEIKVKKDE